MACGLVFLAAVFDVFDGLAARALGGGTPLGAQLDSLADMVSFGVAPAFLLFAQSTLLAGDMLQPEVFNASNGSARLWPVMTAAIVVCIGSCWRLAKFNIDTRQSTGFLGLPTPSNGLFWVSIVLASTGAAVHPGPGHDQLVGVVRQLFGSPFMVLVLALVLAALMLSELPLPGLKFKHKGWRGNEVIFILISIGAILVLLYGVLAVPLILIIYLLSPLWGRLFKKPSTT